MRKVLRWGARIAAALLVLVLLFVVLAVTGVIGPPKVPPEAIQSAVTRDPALLASAHAQPVAATFGEPIHWQQNGSYCGPASLVNVFRSLGHDVRDEEAVLAGTGKCSLGICVMGLTLDELAEVARARDLRRVTVLRDLNEAEFREHMRRSNELDRRYIANFHRERIFAAGGGHHSPIGGYLEAEDLVLVLDVNETFRPWLVELPRLYAAIDTLDGDHKRGLLLIE